MKTLKFHKSLIELILKGEKNKTWRLFDDKNLSKGDIISFINRETKREFTLAKIINIKKTTFGKFIKEDLIGHEKFSSDKEMYLTYSRYYNCQVDRNSSVKIIKFELQ